MINKKSLYKFVHLLTISLLFSNLIIAQLKVCSINSVPPNNCAAACIYCDIHNLKGRNTTIKGNLPATFCTPITDNAQWIPFIAGSRDLTVTVDVANCIKGDGLEMSLFDGDGCSNLAIISSCFTDVSDNTSARMVVVQPLIIGEMYWLLIDGNNGDVCDWHVRVTLGSTVAPNFKDNGTIIVPDLLCQNQDMEIRYNPPIGSVSFDWTLDGDTLQEKGIDLPIKFKNSGVYDVCVTAYNGCYRAKPNCKKLVVVQPPSASKIVSICANERYRFRDSLFNIGVHTISVPNSQMCDSIILLHIKPLPNESPDKLPSKFFTLDFGDSLDLRSIFRSFGGAISHSDPSNFSWCKNCFGDIVRPNASGYLPYRWLDKNNCPHSDSIYFDLEHESLVIAPTIIKRHSTQNSTFQVIPIENQTYTITSLSIYDRWGSLIHTSPNGIIDMIYLNNSISGNTMIWKAIITDKDKNQQQAYGTVILE